MSREEHLAWCKERALEYLEKGDLRGAITSMLSDLSKHPETKGIGEKMGPYGMFLLVEWKGPEEIRHFIEGFR